MHIVQATHDGGRSCVTASFAIALAGTPDQRSNLIKRRWVEHSLSEENIVLAFPQSEVIMRMATIPSISQKEIAAMVSFETARRLPWPAEELALDFQVLAQEEGQSTVLIAVAHSSEIFERMALLRSAGLFPRGVIPEGYVSLPAIAGLPNSGEQSIVVYINKDNVMLGLLHGTTLQRVRHVGCPRPGAVDSIDPWISRLLAELEKTIHGKNMDKQTFFIAGRGCEQKWIDFFAARLKGNVCVVHPSDRVSSAVPLDSTEWSALGAALSVQERRLPNLLSDAERRTAERPQRRREWREVFALSGLLCAFILTAAFARQHSKQVVLRRLTAEHARLAAKTAPLEKLMSPGRSALQSESGVGELLQMIAAATKVLPPEVAFNAIEFEAGRTLLLRGHCASLAAAGRLVESLQQSPAFATAEMRSSSLQQKDGKETVEFSISCTARRAAALRGSRARQPAPAAGTLESQINVMRETIDRDRWLLAHREAIGKKFEDTLAAGPQIATANGMFITIEQIARVSGLHILDMRPFRSDGEERSGDAVSLSANAGWNSMMAFLWNMERSLSGVRLSRATMRLNSDGTSVVSGRFVVERLQSPKASAPDAA